MAGVAAVSGVVLDGTGAVLCVLRSRPPAAGLWSLPGGRVEPGEATTDAVAREIREETGLVVRVGRELGATSVPRPDGGHYVVRTFAAVQQGGVLRAGDDAARAAWLTRDALPALPGTPGLVDLLARVGAFEPRSADGIERWAGTAG